MKLAEDPDLIAGEYVLGTLEADERAAVEERAAQEPAFAAAIVVWERRFSPLHELIASALPPENLWPRFAERLGQIPQPERERQAAFGGKVAEISRYYGAAAEHVVRSRARWRAAAIVAAAIAASLAGLLVNQTFKPRAPAQVAIAPPAPVAPASPPLQATPAPAPVEPMPQPAPVPQPPAESAPQPAQITPPESAPPTQAVSPPAEPAPEPPQAAPPPVEPAPQPAQVAPPLPTPAPPLAQAAVPLPPSRPQPQPERLTAVLRRGSEPGFVVVVNPDERTLAARPLGASPPAGMIYELWLVTTSGPENAVSLGRVAAPLVLKPEAIALLSRDQLKAATFAVSLEPSEGLRTGRPSGPFLFSGKLGPE
jgi:anti-sigma-K factor RskA